MSRLAPASTAVPSMTQRSSRSRLVETARRQSRENKPPDKLAAVQILKTERGARTMALDPENASDIFADRTVSTATVTISRRVPRATQRRAQHTQATRLRSN